MTERDFWRLIVRHLKGLTSAIEKCKLESESYEADPKEWKHPLTNSADWPKEIDIIGATDGEPNSVS